MGQTTGQIERHIYDKRQDLDDNIHELQQQVRSAVDWRTQVQERPLTMMGLAFGVGVVAALLAGWRSSSYRWPAKRRIREQWEAILGAIGASVLAEAQDFAQQLIPRFGQEYAKRELGGEPRPVEWNSRAEAERQSSYA
jgi:hypothetical protein